MTAETIDSGSRHGSSRHGSSSEQAGTYFHRTVTGGSTIRGGSTMLPDYSGHGMSTSGHGPLKNPRTRVVVAPTRTRKDAAADAGAEEGAEAGVEVSMSNAVSEDEADEVDDVFKVVRPAWVDDPDAGLSPEEKKYGEFTDFLDFWRLLDFLDVLRSDSKKSSVFDVFGYGRGPSAPREERGIDELMRETEGGGDKDGGGNALGRFVEVLMQRGKDDSDGKRDDAAFDAFLRALDSDAVVEPEGGASKKGGDSSLDWSEVIEGMSPEDRQIPPELLLRSYWKGVVDPDRDPKDPTAEVPAGWMDYLRSWFGRGADAGSGEEASAAGAELATGVKHREGDVVTVPSEDQIV